MTYHAPDEDILRSIKDLEKAGFGLSDAIRRTAERFRMEAEEVANLWALYDMNGFG